VHHQNRNPGAVRTAAGARPRKFATHRRTLAPTQAVDPVAVFIARCEAKALLFACGALDLLDAVDELQASAVANGLVGELGQDQVQEIMAQAFGGVRC